MLNLKPSQWLPSAAQTRHVLLSLLLSSGLTTAFGQTTYYVAGSGNDGNNGRSPDSPFKTLNRVNGLGLQSGDQVLFRRGDTFQGTLQIRQSGSGDRPIVVDAYGDGNKPILAGSTAITHWNNVGNNTWLASCPSCGSEVTGLYRNNLALPLGRYPNLNAGNRGYLTVQSHSGKNQLTSQQGLPATFTGGEVVYRPVQWILNRATINGQNGNTLNLNGSGNYDISDNWGFFIQNHPATLDQDGEWCYNPADKTIRIYDSQSNPNDQTITATVYNEALSLTNVSNVAIRNLTITQALRTNLMVNSCSNLTFSGNDITNAGEDGVMIAGSGSNLLMENSLIEDVNNNGFIIQPYQNFTFRGNVVRRIGLWPGRGKSGDGTYMGLQSACTANTLIENNIVENIGYNAINFSTSTTLRRNRVSNYCLTKSDGGGLYIWNGNKQGLSDIRIQSNIVYNGTGTPEGTPGGAYSGANGIYLDDCTTNIEVTDNTVFNCRGLGIYLHGSSNVRVTGNTAYNNGEGQFVITDVRGSCSPRNNVVQNNVFVSRLGNQFNVKYESTQNDLGSFGEFSNNVYARPFEDTYKIRAVYGNGSNLIGADLSLAEWQNRYGKDQNTANSPSTYKLAGGNPDDYIRFVYNESPNATQVPIDGTYRDARGNGLSGQVSLPPFSSVVLLKQTSETPPPSALREPENPANTTGGLDYSYYEGSWTTLPDFGALTPVRTGAVNTPDLSVRSRINLYGVRYKGFISVPTDGVYTFYTTSDDGSKLYIGSTEIVNNDGQHGDQERSGSIGLKAGKHALTVVFFQGGGGQTLSVSYSGPTIAKQVIPASAYVRMNNGPTLSQPPTPTLPPTPTPTAGNGTGLRGEYFNNKTLTPPAVLTRTDATVDFDWGNGAPANGTGSDNFSVRWTGQIEAPVSGNYTFSTISDNGVRLWLNGALIIDAWSEHPPRTDAAPSLPLIAGQKYDVRMEMYEVNGGAVARLLWTYPGQSQQAIPMGRLYPAAGSTLVPTLPANNGVYLSDLTWTSASSGYGPIEKDRSNGEKGAGDGRSIKLNGVTYAKGLGVHSPSEVIYNLGGQYTNFISDIGIDDEIGDGNCGSVVFEVYLDGALAYSSDKMYPNTATKSINLNVTGKQTLKLVVTTAGDNYNCDHADWAGARLTGTGGGRMAAVAEERPSEAIVRVYPVPARDEIRLQYRAEAAGEATVQLLNEVAQPVLTLAQPVESGENLIKLDVRALNRGFYVLTLTQGGRRITRKVILTE